MRTLLAILCMITFLLGVGAFVSAKGAVHEIEGLVLLLISAVCLVGAGIVEAVNTLRRDVISSRP